MFTVLRIETLDSWDQILYITMFGCEGYPGGYEFLDASGHHPASCQSNHAYGYLAVLVLVFIALLGAYVLPTVLVGVVSITFDKTSRALELSRREAIDMKLRMAKAKVCVYVCVIFSP
jgi:hypothetical protein